MCLVFLLFSMCVQVFLSFTLCLRSEQKTEHVCIPLCARGWLDYNSVPMSLFIWLVCEPSRVLAMLHVFVGVWCSRCVFVFGVLDFVLLLVLSMFFFCVFSMLVEGGRPHPLSVFCSSSRKNMETQNPGVHRPVCARGWLACDGVPNFRDMWLLSGTVSPFGYVTFSVSNLMVSRGFGRFRVSRCMCRVLFSRCA